MKEIRVSDQPRLGFRRILRITADGIRYRLFRAAVTVAVIAVAVAFLLNILSESLIKRAVAQDTRERVEQSRLVHVWTSHLSAPGTTESILRDIASLDPVAGSDSESARMGKLNPDEFGTFQAGAKRAVTYLDFFSKIDYARSRRLVHQAQGISIFDYLSAADRLESFFAVLRETPSVRLPGRPDDLRTFMTAWPLLKAWVARIQVGEADAIARVHDALNGRNITRALAEADGSFDAVVRHAGFDFSAEAAGIVAKQARRIRDIQSVEKSLEYREPRQVIARHHDILPGDTTLVMLWRFLAQDENAAKYLEAMRSSGVASEQVNAERLVALAEYWSEMDRLAHAELLTADMGMGFLGLGQRMTWLLFVSMLVCAVGISNAMLMTVTERFREIATLKCLGALDSFIMLMFVFESCIMGVVGGVLGGILGALLGGGRMLMAFGISFAGSLPVAQLMLSVGVAVFVGIVLAAIAAIYPSFRAARLAPMEAMRGE
ncbi:MAG: FtsX-like permease family protein [Verrucomicrobia bacterium]|nr:FtsX-like permease family protein [Verrucomicrobiota bacterium]